MTARIVSAEEACKVRSAQFDDSLAWAMANTVVVQGEQIAAVLDLHAAWHHPKKGSLCKRCFESYPCSTARALGVAK